MDGGVSYVEFAASLKSFGSGIFDLLDLVF